jgi:hypothetical protein
MRMIWRRFPQEDTIISRGIAPAATRRNLAGGYVDPYAGDMRAMIRAGSIALLLGLVVLLDGVTNASVDVSDGTLTADGLRTSAGVDELLARSGLKRHIALIGHRLQHQFEAQGAFTPDERAALSRAAMNAYRPDVIYAAVREQLELRRDENKMNELLAWYRLPLGTRLVDLEVAAAIAQVGIEIVEYAERLKENPPTYERLESLQRLDAAVGNTDLSVDLAMVMQESMARAIDPVLPPERRMKPGQLQRDLARMRAEIVTPTRNAVLLTMLFTYRSVGDEDVRAYLRLMESPAGRWFSEATRRAMLQSIAAAAEMTATELARMVPPEVWLRGEFSKPRLPE